MCYRNLELVEITEYAFANDSDIYVLASTKGVKSSTTYKYGNVWQKWTFLFLTYNYKIIWYWQILFSFSLEQRLLRFSSINICNFNQNGLSSLYLTHFLSDLINNHFVSFAFSFFVHVTFLGTYVYHGFSSSAGLFSLIVCGTFKKANVFLL